VKICTLTNSPFPDLFFRESDRYSTLVHAVSALRFKRIDFKRVRFLMVRESQHSLSVVFDVSSWSTFRIMRFSLSNLKLRRFSIRHLRRQQKLILNHQTGTGLEGYGRAPSLNFRKPPDPAWKHVPVKSELSPLLAVHLSEITTPPTTLTTPSPLTNLQRKHIKYNPLLFFTWSCNFCTIWKCVRLVIKCSGGSFRLGVRRAMRKLLHN
jgi:hypothetical protein